MKIQKTNDWIPRPEKVWESAVSDLDPLDFVVEKKPEPEEPENENSEV